MPTPSSPPHPRSCRTWTLSCSGALRAASASGRVGAHVQFPLGVAEGPRKTQFPAVSQRFPRRTVASAWQQTKTRSLSSGKVDAYRIFYRRRVRQHPYNLSEVATTSVRNAVPPAVYSIRVSVVRSSSSFLHRCPSSHAISKRHSGGRLSRP